ncbi:MAG: lamin tail domain-containing protein [Lewinellaceae bacterium]|nr:lamin tail domain-containing protein [Lewinellaceae bacterium]
MIRSIILLVVFICTIFSSNAQVLLYEIYGAGGNSGAIYDKDYVVLYNYGASNVDISSWSIQYASSSGSSWNKGNIPSGTFIVPGVPTVICVASSAGTNGASTP